MLLEHFIRIEESKALSKQRSPTLFSTLLLVFLTVATLWSNSDKLTLASWGVFSLFLIFCRWWTTRKFTPESTTVLNASIRLKIFTIWYALYGLNWGTTIYLFHDPSEPLYSVFFAVVLVTYISAGVFVTSSYLPAFFGLAIPLGCISFLRFITEDGMLYFSLGLSTPIYILIMSNYAKTANRNFKETKKVEYDNLRLLEEVTKQKDVAEKSVIEKNRFLSATSHDLRQPLHAMGLFIDALKPRLSDPQDLDILDRIAQSGRALNELLHGLLDISKLDANAIENRPQHV